MHIDYVTCEACGEECPVDGEYPRYSSYCETCKDEPEGFDVLDYGAEKLAQEADYLYDRMKDGDL